VSRGLGQLQRRLLAVLAEDHPAGYGPSVRRLARRLYGREVTRAQAEAVRQAVAGLERRGLVTTRRTLGRHRVVRLATRRQPRFSWPRPSSSARQARP
jgi:hypothetical protein